MKLDTFLKTQHDGALSTFKRGFNVLRATFRGSIHQNSTRLNDDNIYALRILDHSPLVVCTGPVDPRLVATVLQNFVGTGNPNHCMHPGPHTENFALSRKPVDVGRFQLACHCLPQVILRTQFHRVLACLSGHPTRHYLPR